MESVWMGISPSPAATRVVAMAGPSETILKAQLGAEPKHPRALGTLLEAVALWQGLPVRAALCVGTRAGSCDSNLYRDALSEDGGALYSVVWVPRAPSVGASALMASATLPLWNASSLGRWRDDH